MKIKAFLANNFVGICVALLGVIILIEDCAPGTLEHFTETIRYEIARQRLK